MKNKAFKKLRNTLFVGVVHVMRLIIFFIPWKLAGVTGAFIGFLAFAALPKERAKIYRNLDLVYGDGHFTAAQKRAFALKNCFNYGIGAFEFAKFGMWPVGKISGLVRETEGLDRLEKIKNSGKPCVAVTAHYGNWEIMPAYMANMGFNTGVIGKRIFDPRLNELVNGTRLRAGIRLFDRDNLPREMIKGLKNDMMLGILVDQDTNVESMTLKFLGRDAKTPVAPAVLAKKYNTWIVGIFIERMKNGYYRIVVNEPYMPGPEDTVEKIALRYNDEISAQILKDPLQWAWVHERFKSTVKNKQ